MIKRFFLAFFVMLFGIGAFAQMQNPVEWSAAVNKVKKKRRMQLLGLTSVFIIVAC